MYKLLLLSIGLLFGAALPLWAAPDPVIRESVAVCDPGAPTSCISSGTLVRVQSAATTNATSVKASSAVLVICNLGNNGAGAAYFKLYNKASAPTVGTDTPVATLLLPAGGLNDTYAGDLGLSFSTGFAYAITGASADADTTAVAANQVTGFCSYK